MNASALGSESYGFGRIKESAAAFYLMRKKSFSKRFGYDPNQPSEPIVEDAPQWLRIDYCNNVLRRLSFTDMDSRIRNIEDRPLGVKQLHEDFCVRIRAEMDQQGYDSWYAQEELEARLKAVEWYHFYDFVELVAERLQDAEDARPFEDEWVAEFGLERYRRDVNTLFAENTVEWRLDRRGILSRENAKILAERTDQVAEGLSDNFSPSRAHFVKARRYLFEHPMDPENAIKEITSAVESVARSLYPNASTLGAALKEARRNSHMPPLLISMGEKYYAYASAEPAVRHGASVESRVIRDDAEFVFYTGIAFIRYLIASHADDAQQ